MTDSVIQTTSLTKKYGAACALNQLTISIAPNTITGLIGRNGSGKTTLMQIIAGRLNKTSGTIKVWKQEPVDNLPLQSRLIYTCHDIEYTNTLRLDMIIRNYKRMFQNFDYDFSMKLMKYFDLSPRMKYRELSQGMGSIFNFICALSVRADLTILDEPVPGMDITIRKAAYEVLLRDYNEYPRTFIISSHLLAELEGTLSNLLLIDHGNLMLHDDIDIIRTSAYQIEGEQEKVRIYCKNKNVLHNSNQMLKTTAIIYEPLNEEVRHYARQNDFKLSSIRPEELCVYLTRENKKEELECLWNQD